MNKVISYATGRFKQSQKVLEDKSMEYGADQTISYGPKDIEKSFVQKNIKILSNTKGGGLWLWKPHLILKTLLKSNNGDVVLYCDAGMYPISNLNPLFKLAQEKEIVLFQVHDKKIKDWTTPKCIELMGCSNKILELEQICGAPQVYSKCEKSILFLKNLVSHCENNDLINDFGNKNHRHDQSILSIMAHQKNIEIHRDPSQWGNEYPRQNSMYPQIFNLHRGNL
jgi:hypothetical protein